MPTCGNCGKTVASSDVTCPHCGVLLAAYASPMGSSSTAVEVPVAAPEPVDLPEVDLSVPAPSETAVTTDPNETVASVSTAPRPLFDTKVTVEQIARAAESDHDDEVVTIDDPTTVPTQTVTFDVPDYAKPPEDAAPLPTVTADGAMPVITHDDDPAVATPKRTSSAPRQTAKPAEGKESWLYADDDINAPEPGDQPEVVDWFNELVGNEEYESATKDDDDEIIGPSGKSTDRRRTNETPAVNMIEPGLTIEEVNPQHWRDDEPESESTGQAGTTEDYLRRLHEKAGLQASGKPLSRPVKTRSSRKTPQVQDQRQLSAQQNSTRLGCSLLYFIMMTLTWLGVLASIFNSELNPLLLVFALGITWAFKPMNKVIDQVARK